MIVDSGKHIVSVKIENHKWEVAPYADMKYSQSVTWCRTITPYYEKDNSIWFLIERLNGQEARINARYITNIQYL